MHDDDLLALAYAVGVADAPWTVADTLGVVLGCGGAYILYTGAAILLGGDPT